MILLGIWLRRVSLLAFVMGAMCASAVAHAQGVPVAIANTRSEPIQVNFTTSAHKNGPIKWVGQDCANTGSTGFSSYATIPAGKTCTATVDPSANSSRFCATTSSTPMDCFDGQANHLTLVETTFLPASNPGCFGKGACVWYDISVIPSNCTDELWAKDRCKGTGGASYNLPVALQCKGASEPIYICKGPANTKYGPENYPSNCGNPDATCATGTQGCRNGVSAYFRPMFSGPPAKYQPNAACLRGTFTATFVGGP